MFKPKVPIVAAMAMLLLLYLGCSKLTGENYDKLKMGMDYSEVLEIIGDADECSEGLGVKNCRWGASLKHIEVSFVADKVVMTSKKGL